MSKSIGTHFSDLIGAVHCSSGVPTTDVQNGDLWFDTDTNQLMVYYGGVWRMTGVLTTSTSSSTSSTSTSTSTTA